MPRGKWLACLVVLASTTPDVFPAAAEEEDDATPPGAAPGAPVRPRLIRSRGRKKIR